MEGKIENMSVSEDCLAGRIDMAYIGKTKSKWKNTDGNSYVV